jgi:hypothetical protein
MQARGWEYETRLTGELDGIMHVEDTEGGLGTVNMRWDEGRHVELPAWLIP